MAFSGCSNLSDVYYGGNILQWKSIEIDEVYNDNLINANIHYNDETILTGWQKIGEVWYYFLESGELATGWQKVGSTWYYFKDSGAMAANEWCDGYWLNKDGSWTYQPKGSWKQNSTGWWFGDTSGWYAKNSTVKIDNVNYKFNASGYWVK